MHDRAQNCSDSMIYILRIHRKTSIKGHLHSVPIALGRGGGGGGGGGGGTRNIYHLY